MKLRAPVIFILFMMSLTSYAQQQDDVFGGESTAIQPRQQLGVIVFSGLGGGILGLSTLSFYSRPQDNLENIAYGFALGVIAGTIYTTYDATNRSYKEQESQYGQNSIELQDLLSEREQRKSKELRFPLITLNFEF